MCLCVYVCLCVSVSVCLCVCVSVCLSVCGKQRSLLLFVMVVWFVGWHFSSTASTTRTMVSTSEKTAHVGVVGVLPSSPLFSWLLFLVLTPLVLWLRLAVLDCCSCSLCVLLRSFKHTHSLS